MSCSDDDPTEGTNNNASLSAKVDGTNFSSLEATVSAVKNSGILAIQGSDANGKYIRFNISSYNGEGTYKTGDNLTNTNMIMYGTVSPVSAWSSTFDIGSGTITISKETDSQIEGTFGFEGYNADDKTTKTITEGKFVAPKQ